MLDFKILFISDGTSAMSPEEHQATLDTLAQSFADVMTTDDAIQEIEKLKSKNKVLVEG